MPEMDTDLLKHFHLQQRDELNYRRRRLYQIFTWTLTIFLGSIAVLVGLPDSALANPVWPIAGTLLSIALAVFSTRWQSEQQRDAAAHGATIARIADQLGAFESGIYPKVWKETWGVRPPSRKRQIMTWLLALITVLVMWTSSWGRT